MAPVRETITTIDIGRLVWPYWWIKWANAILVSIVVVTPTSLIAALIKGEFETAAFGSIFLSLLAFPGWIAWKNVDVIHSVGQQYTIRTLGLSGAMLMIAGGVGVFAGANASAVRDQQESFGYGAAYIVLGLMFIVAALAVALLRRQLIGVISVPLKHLVCDLEGQAHPSHPREIRARHPARGWTLIALALIIFISVDFIPMQWMSVSTEARVSSNIGQFAFILILLARGCFQPTARHLLAADVRPPVLLLRSFIDDERISWQQVNASMFDTSFEARLVGHFERFGPFIAVGTPQEGLPVIGAAREQLPDDEWQAQVIAWIRQSRFILLLAGVTEWVDWELQQVIANNAVGKLMICFPPVGKQRWKDKTMRKFKVNMQARLDRLRRGFAGTPWEGALARLDDASSLRSLSFAADGQITVVRARSRDRNAYHLAVLVAQWVTLRESLAAAQLTFSASLRPAQGLDAVVSRPALWTASAALVLTAAALLVAGSVSLWGAGFVPVGLAALVVAVLVNPAVRRPLARLRLRGAATWTGVGVALALVVHASLVFGLAIYGEVTADQEGDAAALSFGAMRYPAQSGLASAQYNLGVFYLNGHGVAKDEAQSCQWVQRAARAGYATAERLYGICLMEGAVQPGPQESGVAFLERASARGDVNATGWLADSYRLGKGVAKDPLRAIAYYEAMASTGHAGASSVLGLMYLNGNGVPVQYDKARAAFEKADAQGDADASYYLGFMTLQGHGLPRDARVAAQHFERAVARGSHGAEMMLGAMFAEGTGVPRDVARARELLTAARASDNARVREAVEEVLRGLAP